MSPFEQQVAEVLEVGLDRMIATTAWEEGDTGAIARALAPRVATAIDAAIGADNDAPSVVLAFGRARNAALRVLRGGGDGAP